ACSSFSSTARTRPTYTRFFGPLITASSGSRSRQSHTTPSLPFTEESVSPLYTRSTANMLMPDLSERIGCALLNPEGMLWLPNLTEELVSSGWQDLNQKCGLSPYNYSTDRVIACNIYATCNRIVLLSMMIYIQDEIKTIKIELLIECSCSQYQTADIKLYKEIDDRYR